MIYRDSRDQCPRCGTELVDARTARGCSNCGGMWIGHGDVQEMAQQMRVPLEPIVLPFEHDQRTPLPCPDCSEPMRTLRLYGVEIDTCAKHGVWFDVQELGLVLLRAANPSP